MDHAPLRLRIDVADQDLSERLHAALSGLPDVTLTDAGGAADAVVTAPRQRANDVSLSAREQDVLELLAEGASNKEIARRLGISVHTAKFHVRAVTDKFDATGRTDVVASAARKGMLRL